MDRITKYRQILQEYLTEVASYSTHFQLIFDPSRDRYLVINDEWQGEIRIHGFVIQLDIIEERISIQENNTEFNVRRELIERGVSPQDIILGFRSPSIRKLLAAAER